MHPCIPVLRKVRQEDRVHGTWVTQHAPVGVSCEGKFWFYTWLALWVVFGARIKMTPWDVWWLEEEMKVCSGSW